MNRLKLAGRKLNLQRLQLKSLRDMKHTERYKEQRKVLFLLFLPTVLFNVNKLNIEKNPLYKYANVLNSNVQNDEFYQLTKEVLSSNV